MVKKAKKLIFSGLMLLVFNVIYSSTSWSYTFPTFGSTKLYTYNTYHSLNSNTRCVVSYFTDHYRITYEKYKYVYINGTFSLKWVGEASWNVPIADTNDFTFSIDNGSFVAELNGVISFIVTPTRDFILRKLDMVSGADPFPQT